LTFEAFTRKLGIIQSDYLTVDCTLDIKRDIVGGKPLHLCSETELDKLMNAYRWEYRRLLKIKENKKHDRM
tara:strand:+ start:1566 stop:1778 length:213 start_codon:yes stop_codon:yes gene_type:complete